MESLAISAPFSQWGHMDPGDLRGCTRARAGTPGSIIISRDLELERVIGCAEANISAQADQAHPQIWLPGPHSRSRRSRCASPATTQGTPCAHRRAREQVHAESLGDSPSRGSLARRLAVSRSRRVWRGTTTSAAAWRGRAHCALAREGCFRRSIGSPLSTERLRSTPQPLRLYRRSQEWWLRAAQPAEAGHARGIARVAPADACWLRPGDHHPRYRR